MQNPVKTLAQDTVELAKWSRDVVRFGGERFLKALNPRAIKARNIGFAAWSPHNRPQIDQHVLSETETYQPIVWRCIEQTAEDAADETKSQLLMFKGTTEDRGDQLLGDAHPMLDLLRNPVPDVSATVWRQNIFADLRAAGDWFSYIYMMNGLPKSFERLHPGDVTPNPDPSGRRVILNYEWDTLDARGTLGFDGRASRTIPVDEMAHVKTRNPRTQLRGLGALSRLWFQLQMDKAMQEWNWGRYMRGIPTEYMIFFNGQFNPGDRDRIEADLRRKAQPSGDNFWLIEGDGDGGHEFKVEKFPRPTEDELAFLDSEQRIAYRIIMAFGVPPLKIMDLTNSSILQNTEIQDRIYWESTIPSLHRLFIEFLNAFARKFYSGWGPVFFEYDYSNVPALKENQVEQSQVLGAYVDRGILTRNEVREVIGWSPVEEADPRYVPELDQFLQMGRKLGGSDLAALFGPAATSGDDENGNGGGPPTDEDEDDEDEVDDGEKVVKLRSLPVKKQFEHFAEILDLDEEKDAFDRKVRSRIRNIWRAAGEQQLELAGIAGNFDMLDQRVIEAVETQIIELAQDVVENTNGMVRAAIADGIASGASIPSMRKSIQDAFKVRKKPEQLDRIARTEVHQAQEGGSHAAAVQNGVEMKQWVTARDSRVRGLEMDDKADHDGIEKQGPIPINVPFKDPRSGAQLMFPGDRSGALSGADTINCRCVSVPDFSHLELSARPAKQKSHDRQWFAKAERADMWQLDLARQVKSYLIGMERRALRKFDALTRETGDVVAVG